MTLPYKNIDYQREIKELQLLIEDYHTVEEILNELEQELVHIKEKDMLEYTLRIFVEIQYRYESEIFTNIRSPYTTGLYLLDFYYSIPNRSNTIPMTLERWHRITELVTAHEYFYFKNIEQSNNPHLDPNQQHMQIKVAIATFIEYYNNPSFCYNEQTRDRIVTYFTPYNDYINKWFGFGINDILAFVLHLNNMMNQKYTDLSFLKVSKFLEYQNNPSKWRELTRKFENLGLNPDEWQFQPEVINIFRGENINLSDILLHPTENFTDIPGISKNSAQAIFNFLLYDKETSIGKLPYYSTRRIISDYPIIPMGKTTYFITDKYILEALYNRIHQKLLDEIGTKYKQKCDNALENNVLKLFKKLFGTTKTKYFINYTLDYTNEQDILIIYKNACIIIEVKDYKFREPSRDPIKGYERIKSDFKNIIQKGYDQCKRVESKLYTNNKLEIYDNKTKKLLHTFSANKIEQIYPIVITNQRYGCIQTDLSDLLVKEKLDRYPLSICISDLESMILLFKKVLKNTAEQRFLEYLDFREAFHEHLICTDELELAGLYLSNMKLFKELATSTECIYTHPAMAEIFNAYYNAGLGFDDEYNIDVKCQNPIGNYPTKFNVDLFDPTCQ